MTKSATVIRREFIDFFKSKKHRFVPSAPVVPQDDPTLLFTNAGMNQFKSIFMGESRGDLKRAANSQKCMRVSGKHNDLEEVGVDHHHHTFFEMLGNWSFGDYYKKEAITWAWELLTDVWGLPKDKLYATVFEDDKEAEELWKTETDIDNSHISRHSAKDNFWEMGKIGPCGPCSEIHLDNGPGYCANEKEPGHKCGINVDGCSRHIEIWNLVFIQFNREEDSSLHELPSKHIDTGMGFERVVRLIQKSDSNYATDLFEPIIKQVEKLSGKKYEYGSGGTPFRVIADHIRALVFAITDGAFPSNEGRGYVVRRLLRRAYRFGRKLDFSEPFLYKMVPVVIDIMGDAFPEITQRREYVEQIIKSEEERFDQTLELGLEKISQMIEKTKASKKKQLSGTDVFTLYDTYGFPMDLTRLISAEQELAVDEGGFEKLMALQRTRARDAAKAGGGELSAEGWVELKKAPGTEFVGHDNYETEVSVCRYKVTGADRAADSCKECFVVLDKTPFYAEMGGQLGDTGVLIAKDKTELAVTGTITWNDMAVHKVKAGEAFPVALLKEPLRARINSVDRMHTERNHSATHLLQAALRKVLGDHVSQSGSRVAPEGFRFDFTHFKALTPDELRRVEDQVNEWIFENLPVETTVKKTDEAKEAGAIALFGEKYGESVRVVNMGEISMELCGGTHTSMTGNIGMFHIVSESSIAAGVRRIEAVTGMGCLKYFQAKEQIVSRLSDILRVNEEDLIKRITENIAKVKSLGLEMGKLMGASAGKEVEKLIEKASKGAFPWVAENFGSMDRKRFVNLTDKVSDTIRKKNLETAVIFLGAEVDGKAQFSACCGPKAVDEYGIHCGELVKAAAKVAGGGGGGSPTRAQAGGKDVGKIQEAIDAAVSIINKKAGIS